MLYQLGYEATQLGASEYVRRGRRGALMGSVVASVSSGSGPGQGHCVVFLGKTLYSHGASLHPGV